MSKEGNEIHKEELDEEAFHEFVLEAQREALEKEFYERIHGVPKKKRPIIVSWIIGIIAFTLFFNTFAIIFQIYSIPAIEFLKTSTRLSQQEDIQNYKKAVVEITTGNSKGTGFAIDEHGLIVTNAHVVEGAKKLSVIFTEDGLFEAEIVASYPDVDLAFIQVRNGHQLPHLLLAEQSNLIAKTPVYFIGNPLAFTNIANEGTLLEITALENWHENVMMLKAPVYRGNSGSPVLDEKGKVIGVIFATMKHDQYGRVGLFIPISIVQQKLQAI